MCMSGGKIQRFVKLVMIRKVYLIQNKVYKGECRKVGERSNLIDNTRWRQYRENESSRHKCMKLCYAYHRHQQLFEMQMNEFSRRWGKSNEMLKTGKKRRDFDENEDYGGGNVTQANTSCIDDWNLID